MDRKRLSWALVALGAALFAISALADPLSLGDGNGIGAKQVTGMIVGGVVAVAGLVLVYRGRGGVTSSTTSA